MRLESARALKAEILEQVTSAEASDLAAGGVWSMNARPTADVDPVARTVALGITRPTPGDYRLAIRVQRAQYPDPVVVGAPADTAERALAAAAHDHHVSLFRHVDECGNDG